METDKFICTYCAFESETVEEFFMHECTPYDSEVNYSFPPVEVEIKVPKFKNLHYSCLFCDYIADTKEALDSHRCKARDDWESIKDDLNMRCRCDFTTESTDDWLAHVCNFNTEENQTVGKVQEDVFACKNCELKTTNREYYKTHKCNDNFIYDEWWNCMYCPYSTSILKDYLSHDCDFAPVDEEYRCDKCNFSTTTGEDYLFHDCTEKYQHSIDQPCTSNCTHLTYDNKTTSVQKQGTKRKSSDEMDGNSKKVTKKNPAKANFRCRFCKRGFIRENACKSHEEWCGNREEIENSNDIESVGRIRKVASAFSKFMTFENRDIESIDIDSLQASHIQDMVALINKCLQIYNCLKFEIIVDARLSHPINPDITSRKCFHSIMRSVLHGDSVETEIMQAFGEIKELIDQHTERGSGWTLNEIQNLQINIGKYVPHRGGCSYSLLPKELVNKKCLLSIQTDDSCFLYTVLATLHPCSNNPQRKSHYLPFLDAYDTSNLSIDEEEVDLYQAEKFAKKNNLLINIYTYDVDEKCVIPLKIMSKQDDSTTPILLFLYDGHYYKITSFDRLASTKNKYARKHCIRCLSSFKNDELLEKHAAVCFNNTPQRLIMPDPYNNSSKFTFHQFSNEIMFPYVIYADFETLSITNEDEYRVRTLPVCSFGYVAIDWNGNIVAQDFDRGSNCGEKFLRSISETKKRLDIELALKSKPLVMSDDDENAFLNAKKCFICSHRLHADKVRDHDHLTGKYRGAAHNACNLKYRLPSKLPIFFHNLKNFDSHIIMQALTEPLASDIFIIPHTMEKYIAFTFKNFIFLDSFAFLPSSLESLSENLTTEYKSKFISQVFTNDSDLLMKKAALPYEYIDSFNRFDETSLPEIDKFYSSLKESNISVEMYNHLQNIWKKFGCRTLGDFHDIYLKVDVILLAAVFENFRKVSYANFNLDPCHNFSIPGFSMNSALRYTRAKAGLITDIDMFLMIEKDIRGGLTVVSKRYCKTEEGKNEIVYLDVNNLYGYAMSQPLPYDNFEWVDTSKQTLDQMLSDCKYNTGMIFEVDLIYPEHLHDDHNDYPLAPHKMEVTEGMHSKYQKELLARLKERNLLPSTSKKLLATFNKREKYSVHHQVLKYYISKGLIVTKVHRAFKFKEKAWLQPYVEFCTKQRQAATNSFDRDIWKLNVNSIYGKCIEDKRKHRRCHLIFKESLAIKRLRSELCESFTIIGQDKILFQLKKGSVYMNKPVAVGFAVLELAKLKMFQIHYDHFKAHLGNNIELLYTDTDSLIYNIKTDAGAGILAEFDDIMDFSNYARDHPLYNDKNEKAIGFIKDEMGGKRIEEFIALKPKLYAIKTAAGEKKKAKGITKSTVDKKITFKQYEDCLWNEIIPVAQQKRLQSKNHIINMIVNEKIVMTPFDDKRYLLDDGISTFAHGHFVTKNLL